MYESTRCTSQRGESTSPRAPRGWILGRARGARRPRQGRTPRPGARRPRSGKAKDSARTVGRRTGCRTAKRRKDDLLQQRQQRGKEQEERAATWTEGRPRGRAGGSQYPRKGRGLECQGSPMEPGVPSRVREGQQRWPDGCSAGRVPPRRADGLARSSRRGPSGTVSFANL